MSERLRAAGPLLRLALRRDRVLLPVWTVALVLSAASSASATKDLYPTTASLVSAADAINGTPALVALYGRVLDPTSLGALAMLKLGAAGAVAVSVLAILLVVRHSRADEEDGRLDLVRSAAVGPRAPLAAAVSVALLSVGGVALLTAVSLVAVGLPVGGSFAFAAGWAGCGAVFAGVAAVCAQLATTARGANGLAGGVLGVAYVLRAAGDAAGTSDASWLSWLSPVGWSQQLRPFASERWWVLALFVVAAPLLLALAGALSDRRDVGAGLIATRPGPPTAAASLRTSPALAWRLQRRALAAWTAGFLLLGAVVGAIASGVDSLLDSKQSQDLITRLGGHAGLTDAFLAAELGVAAILASAYAVQAVGRLNTEEAAGHAEAVLVTRTSRVRWAAGHAAVALLGSVLLMLAAGLAAGAVHAVHVHDASQVRRVLAGALVQLPAIWVVGAIVVAAFGLSPRLAPTGWFALAVFLLLGEVGPVVGLDRRVVDLSPFARVPHLPGGTVGLAPLTVLVLVAATLVVLGLVTFRRRDLA